MRKERLTAKTTPWAAALLGAGDLECSRLPEVFDHDDHELYEPWQDEGEDDGEFAFVGFDGVEQDCEPIPKKPRGNEVAQTGGASSSGDIAPAIAAVVVIPEAIATAASGKRDHGFSEKTSRSDSANDPKRQRTQGEDSAGMAQMGVIPVEPHVDIHAALPNSGQQGIWHALQERKRRKLAGNVTPVVESDFARLARKAANE